jgi:threonine dehydrogenase-like Zn-dependent dehydrogenase
VIGVDPNQDRRKLAAVRGAEVLDPGSGDVTEAVKDLTGGRGADSVIEAVGMDAEGSKADRVLQLTKLQPDRMVALHQSFGSVRRGGTVSVVGVYGGWFPKFPLGDLFDKQVTIRWGQANVRRWTDDLLDVLRAGDPIAAAELVSHQVPLAEAPQWYRAFRDKEPGVIKVLMHP